MMMTVTPGGLSFGGGQAKPEPPGISGHLPLIVLPAAGEIRSIEISPGDRLVIGSAEAADLILPGTAPQHGVLYVGEGGDWCAAVFTAAHSAINGEPIFGPRVLHRGDRVRFGSAEFTIEAPG